MFDAFGVELEYMIVNAETLDVAPVTDRVLHEVAGAYESEIELGELAWSNELALHVIELKTNGPAESLDSLAGHFQSHVGRINELLRPMGARLMPTAMHPWMDPDRELKLWPHEYNPIYETYNRIFDCRGHGWSNLQSVHLNLPFADDVEFGRLHAAIRLLMPILPALFASSPIADKKVTGFADYRMEVYRSNSRRVPLVAGTVIPEPVFTKADYEQQIFQPMYDAIAPHDSHGVLQHEWLNARGAIARFTRGAIEIRVIDIQECPAADIAILEGVVAVLKALVEERWISYAAQCTWGEAPLARIFLDVVRDAERAVVQDTGYLAALGLRARPIEAGAAWGQLLESVAPELTDRAKELLGQIVSRGTLASRIARAVGPAPDKAAITATYRQLASCLGENSLFIA
ncbi:MAG: hypothetical protein KDB27_03565 [Planctomycetales bacterium]|nr:hypothetical protein [Planctomycetales bacterium]